MKLQDIQGDHVVSAAVAGQATAGTADEFVIGTAPFDATVTAVEYIPAADITGNDTNNFTLTLRNRGADGADTTAVAALEFAAGTDGVEFDASALIVTGANAAVTAGDVLTAVKSTAGSGLAMPDGAVVVHLQAR